MAPLCHQIAGASAAKRRRPGAALLLGAAGLCWGLAAVATAGGAAGWTFLPIPTASSNSRTADVASTASVARRTAALGGLVLPSLLGVSGASASIRTTDYFTVLNQRKREFVPFFKQGMDYLEKIDKIDERMMLFAPKMTRKMEVYGNGFSMTDAPDKVARQLTKDTAAFKDAIMVKQDKELAIQLFEQYRKHIPKGYGYFDLKDPSTFTAPKLPGEE